MGSLYSTHPIPSHHTTPHHTTPRLTTPHHTTPDHTIPHHTTPHPTTPHHTTPHHTTPHRSPVICSAYALDTASHAVSLHHSLPHPLLRPHFISSHPIPGWHQSPHPTPRLSVVLDLSSISSPIPMPGSMSTIGCYSPQCSRITSAFAALGSQLDLRSANSIPQCELATPALNGRGGE